MNLTEQQIEALAEPIISGLCGIGTFFRDKKNQKQFQRWLKERNEKNENKDNEHNRLCADNHRNGVADITRRDA